MANGTWSAAALPDAGPSRPLPPRWTYLLPSLELGRVLVLGERSAPELAALSTRATDVMVVSPAGGGGGPCDLLVLDDPDAPHARSLLSRGGLAFVHGGRHPARRALAALAGPEELLWILPIDRDIAAAAPAGDTEAVRFLRARTERTGLAARLRRGAVGSRTAALLGADIRRPPRYVCDVAATAGISLAHHRWALHAPGSYASRKIVVFLFAGGRLEYVAKLTQDAAFNARLENERRALEDLAARGFAPGGEVPRVAFAGLHAGLAVVGETAAEGEPFRTRTTRRASCPLAGRAVELLVALGTLAVTLGRAAAAAAELTALLDRYARAYGLEPGHRRFLEEQIALVAASDAPFPRVRQHGDPGCWNFVATKDGRVALLDWEAAVAQGMPLWDLFYFMRSFAMTVSGGGRRALRTFEQELLSDSELSRSLAGATETLRARIALRRELVLPLFFACWLHRAVKESARLPPERLDRGHYARLLRLCIDARDAPALRRLGAGAAG